MDKSEAEKPPRTELDNDSSPHMGGEMAENDFPESGDRRTSKPTYIVGIGASAGGLEALEGFFSRMPADTGMAFVVIQHLSPDFKSLMSELLSRRTEMPIYRVRDGMRVEANSVYLLPPKKEMVISNQSLVLTDKDPTQYSLCRSTSSSAR